MFLRYRDYEKALAALKKAVDYANKARGGQAREVHVALETHNGWFSLVHVGLGVSQKRTLYPAALTNMTRSVGRTLTHSPTNHSFFPRARITAGPPGGSAAARVPYRQVRRGKVPRKDRPAHHGELTGGKGGGGVMFENKTRAR